MDKTSSTQLTHRKTAAAVTPTTAADHHDAADSPLTPAAGSVQYSAEQATRRALSLSWWALCFFLLLSGCLAWLHFLSSLPSPASVNAPTTLFSESRSMQYLRGLTVGVDNRWPYQPSFNRTLQYLNDQLAAIQAAAAPGTKAEWEMIWYTGPLRFPGFKLHVKLVEVPYFVMRLSDGTPATTDSSLVIDAHIDSGYFGPGVSDNGVQLANTLEVLRSIATDPKGYRLPHALIAVLGCEEEGLQGAYSFINSHRWAPSVKAFIDLDAGGVAERPAFLARWDESWTAEEFAAVRYPLAFSFSNDLMSTGIVASGTDFSAYEEKGLPGVDLIYATGGYWYHTPLDDLDHLKPGALQQEGENLLILIERMMKNPEFLHPTHHQDKTSIVSVFSFSFTLRNSLQRYLFGLCAFLLLASLVFAKRFLGIPSTRKYIFAVVIGTIWGLLSLILGLLVPVLMALVSCVPHPLKYYATPALFPALCAVASIFGILLPQIFLQPVLRKLTGVTLRPVAVRHIAHTGALVVDCLLFVGLSVIGFGHAFTILLQLVCGLVALYIRLWFLSVEPSFASRLHRVVISGFLPLVLSLLPAVLWGFGAFFFLVAAFIPTLGRVPFKMPGPTGMGIGAILWAPQLVGALCQLCHSGSLYPSFLRSPQSLVVGDKKSRSKSFGLHAVLFLALLTIALTAAVALSPPYNKEMPSRITAAHLQWGDRTDIRITYLHIGDIADLKKDLVAKGFTVNDCSDAILFSWAFKQGICIPAGPAPLQAPSVTPVAVQYAADGLVHVSFTATPGKSSGRLVLHHPWKGKMFNISLDGVYIAEAASDNKLLMQYGKTDLMAPAKFSFSLHKQDLIDKGYGFQVSGQSGIVSKELRTVLNAIPEWVTPTGTSSIATPSAVFVELSIPHEN